MPDNLATRYFITEEKKNQRESKFQKGVNIERRTRNTFMIATSRYDRCEKVEGPGLESRQKKKEERQVT
jgi:hypothetical protein